MLRRAFTSAIAALVLVAASQAAAQPATRQIHFTADELMAHVRHLAAPEMEGRLAGSPGGARARAWIVEQFRAAGLQPLTAAFEMPFSFERPLAAGAGAPKQSIQGVNVAGICRGTGGATNGAMIITAHYDHLGVRDGAIYHGADDNASGVAVLLALARQCQKSPWTHDAVFVAFDAEEMGLQGARAFLAAMPMPRDRTMAVNINLDMVARGDKGELYVAGTSHTPSLRKILAPVAERAPIKVLFGHDSGGGQDDWTTQSDHRVFHEAGIPFVYFGVEDHPDYHRPTDTADKIDPKFFFASAVTILDAVTGIDRALPLPPK